MHNQELENADLDLNEGNYFVVTMRKNDCGMVYVRSCEIIGSKFRNRTSFGENATLDTAFVDRLSTALLDCVEKISQEVEMLSLPNFVIELPHLVLAGPRLIASKLEDGSTHIIMRFASFLGAINSAFRYDLGFSCNLIEHSSTLAAKVLGDLAAPILNICTSAELEAPSVADKLGNFGKKLAENSYELRFQIELLSRFASQQSHRMQSYPREITKDNRKHLDTNFESDLLPIESAQ